MKKRDFIKNMGALAIGPWASTMMEAPRKLSTLLPKASDEYRLMGNGSVSLSIKTGLYQLRKWILQYHSTTDARQLYGARKAYQL